MISLNIASYIDPFFCRSACEKSGSPDPPTSNGRACSSIALLYAEMNCDKASKIQIRSEKRGILNLTDLR